LPLGKTQYPLYRRLGGPRARSGQVRKISRPPGFELVVTRKYLAKVRCLFVAVEIFGFYVLRRF